MQISGLLSPDARLEEDVAKGRRDWAYSERDKVTITTIIMTNFVIIISITIILNIIITITVIMIIIITIFIVVIAEGSGHIPREIKSCQRPPG